MIKLLQILSQDAFKQLNSQSTHLVYNDWKCNFLRHILQFCDYKNKSLQPQNTYGSIGSVEKI